MIIVARLYGTNVSPCGLKPHKIVEVSVDAQDYNKTWIKYHNGETFVNIPIVDTVEDVVGMINAAPKEYK